MYLRHSTVRKGGKTHTYWRLVRSVRRNGKVVQETVAHLGELVARAVAGTVAHLAVRTPTPTVSIDSPSVLEGDGEHNAIFTVTLAPATNRTVTVNYRTADETASEGSDYIATSGTLTFAPGETSKTIAVSVVGDTTLEYDESYSVLLSNPSNAVIGDGSGTGTILEDDMTVPALSVNDVTLAEGNAGKTVKFTVSLSAASDQTVTVEYARRTTRPRPRMPTT